MQLIRLITGDAEMPQCAGIAARLRGVAVELHAAGRGLESADVAHAVAFVGSAHVTKPVVEWLVSAGTHVLLATEPCLSAAELDSLAQQAQHAGVKFSVCNPDRFLPSRQLIKQQVGGKLGNTALVRIHRWEPARSPASPALSPFPLPGPLMRDLELALWLTDSPPDRVYAIEHRQGGVPAGRFIQVQLGFSEGTALLDYTDRLPSGPGYSSLSVIGVSGAAYADDHQNMQLAYQAGGPRAVRTEEGPRQYAALVQDFADAVAEGRDLAPTVTAWRKVYALADAVCQSLETRQAVQFSNSQ